ncbi:MAG: hypothetical protein IJT94_00175, partial [Oscillibacter sp.]|nr:hypothetical protein [Oscillibacter sp.]
TGQRLKNRRAGLGAGTADGLSFYDWAAGLDETGILSDPEVYVRYAAALDPSIQLNSDNSLTWFATVDDLPEGTHVIMRDGSGHYGWMVDKYYSYSVVLRAENGWNYDGPVKEGSGSLTVTLNPDRRSWRVVYRMGSNTWYQLGLDCYYLAPHIDGTYNPAGFPSIRGSGSRSDGSIVSLDKNYGSASSVMYAGRNYFFGSSEAVYNQTSAPEVTANSTGSAFTNVSRASAVFDNYLPAFRVIPHVTSSMAFGPRPGKLPGSPVSETEMTFTHPLTGERVSFDSYTYDYQTRTYTLSLPDDGGTMTVAFGDTAIFITDRAGTRTQAPYPESAGIFAPSSGEIFDKTAFLSGLAAGKV